jgi:hypothetical protein
MRFHTPVLVLIAGGCQSLYRKHLAKDYMPFFERKAVHKCITEAFDTALQLACQRLLLLLLLLV